MKAAWRRSSAGSRRLETSSRRATCDTPCVTTYLALGPLVVMDGTRELALGGNNQRRLLAMLIAHLDREVTVAALAEGLWSDRPPSSEAHAVRTVVSRLRRALGDHRDDVITTPDGYRLATTDCDVARFEQLVAEAGNAEPGRALELTESALSLWRGPAFGALADDDAIRLEAMRLDQLRAHVADDRFELLLDAGRSVEAIPELQAAVAAEPLRERTRGLLMLALYRAQRQPEALRTYAEYRNLLGEDLGLEPSRELQLLEESIILDEVAASAPAAGASPRLYGRLGKQVERGPEADDLEIEGWKLLWEHDHEGSVEARQRAYVRLLDAGDRPGAARLAIWLGVNAAIRLRNAVAFGWLERAQRLLDGVPPGPAHGLLAALIGMVEVLGGDLDSALEHATAAQHIGIESGDLDVEALGKVVRGWAMVRRADVKPGMALLDEAMASAVSGELGAYVSALVYCRTLCACLDLMDYQRAAEWTDEIQATRDSGGVADLPGDCRTHRVAILLVKGDWVEGEREAAIACAETAAFDMTHLAIAKGLRGEILLRWGDLDAAEAELTEAQELGASPYPGLALIHSARGDDQLALQMISAAAQEVEADPLRLAQLLPAFVEIALSAGDVEGAGTAAATLEEIAQRFGTSALKASAGHAQGAVQLATGDPAAVRTLRSAWRRWQEVGSAHRAAAARLLLAEALAAAGRTSDAAIEEAAARTAFNELEARSAVAAQARDHPA